MRRRIRLTSSALLATALFTSGAVFSAPPGQPANETGPGVYDEAAYTEYVENTMQKLDRLYLDFCVTCGADAAGARLAKQEFLATVRDLMQQMNARFDNLDPKEGAALSPTDTLVTVHVLTMLVDILAATEIEQMAAHPYIE
ncbi:MAG: hypothetical protein OEM60_04440 [Gammaproteobacteria bacterium]|nr:hypothetical protein [Gammaproteobacteria bacterium]